MTEQLAIGIGLVLVAGLLNGSFAAPMKGMTAWRWENSWLIFAITGLIIFPWIITFLTVPHVGGRLFRHFPGDIVEGDAVRNYLGSRFHAFRNWN